MKSNVLGKYLPFFHWYSIDDQIRLPIHYSFKYCQVVKFKKKFRYKLSTKVRIILTDCHRSSFDYLVNLFPKLKFQALLLLIAISENECE